MDGLAKHLSSEIHFLEVVWGRYLFMVLISLPITFIFFSEFLLKNNKLNPTIVETTKVITYELILKK